MRNCMGCGIADRAVLEWDASCRGKCSPDATNDVATHTDECPRVIHEVRRFYKPVRRSELATGAAGVNSELSGKWKRAGWTLLRDGPDLFRWKMLCRTCIGKEAEREMLRRDYEKACRKARGLDDRTYGQLMMQQW